jgi:hypothetical protein
VRELPLPPELPLSTILNQQSKWEDIHPEWYLGAQPVILGVHFTKKMGMLDSKLWKFMWQICTTSGSIEEVLGESSDLIAFNFNEGTDLELCL